MLEKLPILLCIDEIIKNSQAVSLREMKHVCNKTYVGRLTMNTLGFQGNFHNKIAKAKIL